ncbi:MAG: polyprenyl synthetase family protein [Bacteroidota bacterium]
MIKSNLSNIQQPIEGELKQFDQVFKESLKSDIRLVDFGIKFILRQKGKRIRPLLVLLSAKISGEVNMRSFRGATLVELLHTATLVHDDVVDEAEKRRGLPSLNNIWGNKISVLMGDFLLSKGLMISVDGEDYDFLKTITSTVKRMSEGELLQIYKSKKLDIDEETYFKIISDKTASLLSTCCEIGALSSTSSDEKIKAMREYGEYLGIAFQIKDDILDFTGSKIIGKPLGGDIKEKKLTLPLIHTLSQGDKSQSSEIMKLIKKGKKKKNILEVIKLVKTNGGIEYSAEVARSYAEKAKNCLNIFEESEYKNSLISLVDFVVDREK